MVQNFDVNKFKVENDLENKFIITYVGAHGIANYLDQCAQASQGDAQVSPVFQRQIQNNPLVE